MIDLDWHAAGEHLVSARAGDVALLRLDRPAKLNALTPAMLPAIAERIRGLAAESAGLVLTGTGRAFSAGDDLDATADLDRGGFEAVIAGFQDMTRAVLDTEVPVVAALNGLAVGGAAELTLACDARVGGPEAAFFFPENGIGLTISNGSTYLLPRILGTRALPLVLAGGRIDADRGAPGRAVDRDRRRSDAAGGRHGGGVGRRGARDPMAPAADAARPDGRGGGDGSRDCRRHGGVRRRHRHRRRRRLP